MKKCYETRRRNTDDKVLVALQGVFTYYQNMGHRSQQPTAQLRTLNSAHAIVNRRKRLGQSVPESWYAVLQQIYALPTENEWKKHQEQESAFAQMNDRSLYQDVLAKTIPLIGIFKTVFGEAAYYRMLDNPSDPATAMVFGEIVDTVVQDDGGRTMEVMKLYSGYNPVQQPSAKSSEKTLPEDCLFTSKKPTFYELGQRYGLTRSRIEQIVKKESRYISNKLGKYFECLTNNDAETMLQDFRHITGLRQRYEMYRKYKIADVSPKELALAGQWLKDAIIVKQKQK